MFHIRDNVHGYIPLDGMYADIVNTPEFQRLRSIEQSSFRSAYPGARHDRFIHSLGTYHLATKFVANFFRNLAEDFPDVALTAEDRCRLETTFRYAALLHDIGHAPFSHTTEEFFQEIPGKQAPLIWEQLCKEIQAVASAADYRRFVNSAKGMKGSTHEVVSAILLIRNRASFVPKTCRHLVDFELAARMVIGYPYAPTDVGAPAAPEEIQVLGLRNCLIEMLNSSILDVDRLDYLGRDTRMSGFSNAPLDLDCLAEAVTAVKDPDGWLIPAYRDSALQVFDLMFQAKLSHDTWVLANPAARYDAALLAHCIRRLDDVIPGYCRTVFTPEALSQEGVELDGKRYRLLSDVDVAADLKAQTLPEFQELHTRTLSGRRIAIWRSYYEYRHLFGDDSQQVYDFFKDLLRYMDEEKIFIFEPAIYRQIMDASVSEATRRAAQFLNDFLLDPNGDRSRQKTAYSVVLLDRTNAFTLNIDPAKIRIVFSRPGADGRNYSTYQALTGLPTPTADDGHLSRYFYFYRHRGLGSRQLMNFRRKLMAELK